MTSCCKCGEPIYISRTPLLTGRRLCDDCILLLDHVSESTNAAAEVFVED